MHLKRQRITAGTALLLLSLVFANCGDNAPGFGIGAFGFTIDDTPEPTDQVIDPTDPIDNPPPICDPFGGSGNGGNSGLIAKLTYIAPNPPTDQLTLAQYLPGENNVVSVANPVFLSRLNKPDSPFEDGFSDSNSAVLKNIETGEKLIEYFALFIAGQVRLRSADAEGQYQFAVESDDGAILHFKQGSSWEQYLENDGTHAVTLGCSGEKINLSYGQKLPMELGYFQAPRVRIALRLWWRNTHLNEAEPFCGSAINDEAAFMARGWKILEAGNFVLPENVVENPCDVPS